MRFGANLKMDSSHLGRGSRVRGGYLKEREGENARFLSWTRSPRTSYSKSTVLLDTIGLLKKKSRLHKHRTMKSVRA